MSSSGRWRPKTTSQPLGYEIRSRASSSNRGDDGHVATGWRGTRLGTVRFSRAVAPMMCQRCHNEATVHLTEPGKGQRREFHLCPACARKAGLALPEKAPALSLDDVVESLVFANVVELVGELG